MATSMSKVELVMSIANEMGCDKKAAGEALDGVANAVIKEVLAGNAVTLPGIGKISTRDRPARMVRNPATGEQMKKGADKAIKLTVAKAFKDRVNG